MAFVSASQIRRFRNCEAGEHKSRGSQKFGEVFGTGSGVAYTPTACQLVDRLYLALEAHVLGMCSLGRAGLCLIRPSLLENALTFHWEHALYGWPKSAKN